MSSLPSHPPHLSIEEYLRLEHDAVEKHEYFDGELISMAGGTEQHSLTLMNFGARLHAKLIGKQCRLYESNLRVRIPRTPTYVYPDLSVVCGATEFDPKDVNRTTITNPVAIVEVLSPSTESHDRVKKFLRYLTIASLEEYVLVSQDKARVETYFRRDDGSWLFTPVTGMDAVVRLRSLDVSLPLSEIFANVAFPPPDPDDVVE